MTTANAEPIAQLFDYAASQPDGFTATKACAELGWRPSKFKQTVRRLRLLFADDEINLVCDPMGRNLPGLYKLVGNYDDARPWMSGRVGDLESRLETVHAVAKSLLKGADLRTAAGKKVKVIERTVRHLIENLAEIA